MATVPPARIASTSRRDLVVPFDRHSRREFPRRHGASDLPGPVHEVPGDAGPGFLTFRTGVCQRLSGNISCNSRYLNGAAGLLRSGLKSLSMRWIELIRIIDSLVLV